MSTSTVIGKQLPDLPHASGIDVAIPLLRPTLARSCQRHGVLCEAAGGCNAVSSRDESILAQRDTAKGCPEGVEARDT